MAGHSQGPDSLTTSVAQLLFLISESLSQSSCAYKINSCILTLLSCRVDEDEEIIVKAMSDYLGCREEVRPEGAVCYFESKNANLIEVNGK